MNKTLVAILIVIGALLAFTVYSLMQLNKIEKQVGSVSNRMLEAESQNLSTEVKGSDLVSEIQDQMKNQISELSVKFTKTPD